MLTVLSVHTKPGHSKPGQWGQAHRVHGAGPGSNTMNRFALSNQREVFSPNDLFN
jgi:hypothetical protein